MDKFSFRLENILEIKRKFEEQQKNEFMQAMKQLNVEETRLSELCEKREVVYEEAKKSREKTLQLRRLQESQQEIKFIEDAIKQQQIYVKRAKQRADKEQVKLAELMKERKTYEQLREREFEQYKLDMQAEEMKEIDELTSYQYGKREE